MSAARDSRKLKKKYIVDNEAVTRDRYMQNLYENQEYTAPFFLDGNSVDYYFYGYENSSKLIFLTQELELLQGSSFSKTLAGTKLLSDDTDKSKKFIILDKESINNNNHISALATDETCGIEAAYANPYIINGIYKQYILGKSHTNVGILTASHRLIVMFNRYIMNEELGIKAIFKLPNLYEIRQCFSKEKIEWLRFIFGMSKDVYIMEYSSMINKLFDEDDIVNFLIG